MVLAIALLFSDTRFFRGRKRKEDVRDGFDEILPPPLAAAATLFSLLILFYP
jgi:hypothetical protein